MAAVIHLDEPGRPGYPLHHNLSRLPAAPGLPGQAVSAFLLAALGVWAADKFLPRRAAPDAWTRQITLNLPVSPGWLPLAPRLGRLLNFLTGDDWTLKLREASLDLGLKGEWPHAWRPDGVMLFSGGPRFPGGGPGSAGGRAAPAPGEPLRFRAAGRHPADPGGGAAPPLRPGPGAPPGAPGAVSRGPGAVHAEPIPALPGPGAGRGRELWRRDPPHHPGKRLDQPQSAPDGQPPGQLQHPHHPPLLSGAAHGPVAGGGPG